MASARQAGSRGSDERADDASRDAEVDAEVDADAAKVRGEAVPSERVPLTRERIVDAAIAFIDDQGLPGLSMRRLGTLLGVEAMSLYRYVPGREQLLDAVVERIVDEMEADPEVLDSPEHGWQDYLQRLAHGVRRVALTHPKVFPLVASRPAEAPWLRPPLRSLRWVEAFLDGLAREGFNDQASVEAYRAFTSFLLGHLLLEVAIHGADLGPLDVLEEDTENSLAPYPNVRRLSQPLRENHAGVEFEDSLENLLQRLALVRSEN
jgi:AcrR family transcriptional regulator